MLNLPACCYASDDASPAEKAYAAYNAAGDPTTAGLNPDGLPGPTWDMLPENVRAKWIAAAVSVEDPIMANAFRHLDSVANGRAVAFDVVIVRDGASVKVGTIGVNETPAASK